MTRILYYLKITFSNILRLRLLVLLFEVGLRSLVDKHHYYILYVLENLLREVGSSHRHEGER